MFVPVAAMFVGSAASSEHAHLKKNQQQSQGDNVDSGSVNRGSALGVDTLNCHNVSLAADGMLQSWLEPQDTSMHRAVTAAVRIEPHSPLFCQHAIMQLTCRQLNSFFVSKYCIPSETMYGQLDTNTTPTHPSVNSSLRFWPHCSQQYKIISRSRLASLSPARREVHGTARDLLL